MGLSQKLILKQGQSLVMTPQLQQAIKLLQMSSMELQAFVDAELERNPLLEREEASSEPQADAPEKQTPDSLDETFTSRNAAPEDMGGDAEAPEGVGLGVELPVRTGDGRGGFHRWRRWVGHGCGYL